MRMVLYAIRAVVELLYFLIWVGHSYGLTCAIAPCNIVPHLCLIQELPWTSAFSNRYSIVISKSLQKTKAYKKILPSIKKNTTFLHLDLSNILDVEK
jgi:hypothetical protein